MNLGQWLAFNKEEKIHKNRTISAYTSVPSVILHPRWRMDGNKALTELRSIKKTRASPGSTTEDLTLTLSSQHLRAQDIRCVCEPLLTAPITPGLLGPEFPLNFPFTSLSIAL